MADIPFLRNSERAAFKQCVAKWNWGWNYKPEHGLTLAMAVRNAAHFGSIIHLALAEYYTPPGGKDGFARGPNPVEIVEKAFKSQFSTISCGPYFDEVAEKEYWDAAELAKIMMVGYLGKYNSDPAWEVLMPEMRFSARISYTKNQLKFLHDHGRPNSRFITRLVGTFDMPIRDHTDGHVKVVDHKTTNKKENIAWLEKDDQTGTYIAVSTQYLRKAGFISEREEVVGAIWNYLRKGTPDERPTDELGRCCNQPTKKNYVKTLAEKSVGMTEEEYDKFSLPKLKDMAEKFKITVLGDVSKTQPSDLFWRVDLRRNKHNRLRQLERIAEDAQHIASVRAGILPVTKNPGEHCAWCEFKELCAVDEDGGDTEQFIKDVFVSRDMYADHRQGARNSKESVNARQETGVN